MRETHHREDWVEKAGETTGFILEYLKQEKELLTLHFSGKAGKLIGFLLLTIILLGLGGSVLLFLGFAGAHYLQEAGLAPGQSYLTIAAATLFIGLCLWLLRKPLLLNPVLRLLLSVVYEDEH
jgi:hypothetical protein